MVLLRLVIDILKYSRTTPQCLVASYLYQAQMSTLKILMESKKTSTEKKIKFFNEKDNCDVCEQPIEKSFKDIRVGELESKIGEYDSALVQMRTELDKMQSSIEEMNKHSNVINGLKSELKSVTGLLERCQNDLNILNEEKDKTNELKRHIEELNTKIQEVDVQIKDLKQENFYLDVCKSLLHDTGIKSKIIKQYLPIMNQTIQKYLGVLDFYINFTLNEQFEETIKSRYRDEFSYASFSEGEKMRIDLALMFTWREIARLKNSTNTNLLIIDEIFDKKTLNITNILEVNTLESGYLKNENGKFTFIPFQAELQVSPITVFLNYDFDNDGKNEILAAGNYFGVKPFHGRFDSFSGALIKGENKIILGHKIGLDLAQKSVRHLNIITLNNRAYLLVTINDNMAQVYELNN